MSLDSLPSSGSANFESTVRAVLESWKTAIEGKAEVATTTEVTNARGSASSLDARLDASLNEDGTLKAGSTVASDWKESGDTPTYISTTEFSVPGDLTAVYVAGRRLKLTLDTVTVYNTIVTSAYTTLTTVTVETANLTADLSAVDYGITTPGSSGSIPKHDHTDSSQGGVLDVESWIEIDQIYIPAGFFTPPTTNPAEAGTNEYATNDVNRDYFAFDGGATEEHINFSVAMPPSWNRGTIKAKFIWSSDSGSTTGDTVEWGIRGKFSRNDDAIDSAFGTAQVISDTLLSDDGGDDQLSGVTPAITIGGTAALDAMIDFDVYRNTDGTDDMVEDAWLFGVIIQFTRSNSVSAWS